MDLDIFVYYCGEAPSSEVQQEIARGIVGDAGPRKIWDGLNVAAAWKDPSVRLYNCLLFWPPEKTHISQAVEFRKIGFIPSGDGAYTCINKTFINDQIKPAPMIPSSPPSFEKGTSIRRVLHITKDPDRLDILPINDLNGVEDGELLHILGPHFPCGSGTKITGVPKGIVERLLPLSRTTKNVFIESEDNGMLRIWAYCYGESCKPIRDRLGTGD